LRIFISQGEACKSLLLDALRLEVLHPLLEAALLPSARKEPSPEQDILPHGILQSLASLLEKLRATAERTEQAQARLHAELGLRTPENSKRQAAKQPQAKRANADAAAIAATAPKRPCGRTLAQPTQPLLMKGEQMPKLPSHGIGSHPTPHLVLAQPMPQLFGPPGSHSSESMNASQLSRGVYPPGATNNSMSCAPEQAPSLQPSRDAPFSASGVGQPLAVLTTCAVGGSVVSGASEGSASVAPCRPTGGVSQAPLRPSACPALCHGCCPPIPVEGSAPFLTASLPPDVACVQPTKPVVAVASRVALGEPSAHASPVQAMLVQSTTASAGAKDGPMEDEPMEEVPESG